MMNVSRTTSKIGAAFVSAIFLAAITVGMTGCGPSGAAVGVASGKVTYNGVAVTGGNLTLHPVKGGPDFPITLTNEGTFSSSGVPEGEMQVTIETESLKGKTTPGYHASNMPGGAKPPPGVDPNKYQPNSDDTGKQPVYMKIPPKYASVKTSGLTWTIEKGNNNKDFPLTD